MPKLEYFLVAESVSVDQRKNTVSLFHVLEELHFQPPLSVVPGMVAVSQWNAGPDELGKDYQVMLRIFSPGDDQPVDLAVNFTAERQRQRLMQTIVGFPLSRPGELKLEVLLNGQHVAYRGITIVECPGGEAEIVKFHVPQSAPVAQPGERP